MTSSEDYDSILAAVMETERGRWFLSEHARRNRVADTAAVMEALTALQARIAVPSAPGPAHLLAMDSRLAKLGDELRAMTRSKRVKRALRHLAAADAVNRKAAEAAGVTLPVRVVVEPALAAVAIDSGLAQAPAGATPPEPALAGEALVVLDDVGAQAPKVFPLDIPSEPSAAAVQAEPAEFASALAAPANDWSPPETSEAGETAPETEDAAAPFAEALDGLDVAEGCAAERLTDAEESPVETAPPPSPLRPRLPPAFVPRLLDSLSEEEKAVLFA